MLTLYNFEVKIREGEWLEDVWVGKDLLRKLTLIEEMGKFIATKTENFRSRQPSRRKCQKQATE